MASAKRLKKPARNEAEAAPNPTKRHKRQPKSLERVPAEYQDETPPFPFLKLPSEIRNMIYHYILVDKDYSIKFEAGVSKRDGRCIVRRLYRARRGPPDRDDLPNQQKGSLSKPHVSWKQNSTFEQASFALAIFQTCRQINEEAAYIFYGKNLFVFEAVADLYAFLTHFSHRLPFIRKIGLRYLPTFQSSAFQLNTELRAVFPLLASAVQLQALYLTASVCQSLSSQVRWWGHAREAATIFFRHAHDWLYAMILRKVNPLAVMRMPAITTKKLRHPLWSTSKNGQDEFLAELARRLKVPFDPKN